MKPMLWSSAIIEDIEMLSALLSQQIYQLSQHTMFGAFCCQELTAQMLNLPEDTYMELTKSSWQTSFE